MISIGAVYEGLELRGSPICETINAIGKAVIKLRGDFEIGKSPAVNVVFYVPGSLGGVDWEGSRDSTFSRKQRLLMVQVAIPKEVADSENPVDFLVEALHEANVIAFEGFRKRKIEYPFDEAETLIDDVKRKLTG